MQGVDLDERLPVAEQLRSVLVAKAVRVVDLFREWDDDGSGCVSRKEFHVGMKQLGLDFPVTAMDTLYDEWDPDGSGHLELKELSKQLRRGNDVTLSAELQAGGAGEIVLKSENSTKLRTKKVDQRQSSMVQGINLDESKPVAQQLRAVLVAKAVRVIDLFREWDDDESGTVTKKEFRMGMKQLGVDFPKAAMDDLFNEWDPDGSGELSLREITKQLRRGNDVTLPSTKKGKSSSRGAGKGKGGKHKTNTKAHELDVYATSNSYLDGVLWDNKFIRQRLESVTSGFDRAAERVSYRRHLKVVKINKMNNQYLEETCRRRLENFEKGKQRTKNRQQQQRQHDADADANVNPAHGDDGGGRGHGYDRGGGGGGGEDGGGGSDDESEEEGVLEPNGYLDPRGFENFLHSKRLDVVQASVNNAQLQRDFLEVGPF